MIGLRFTFTAGRYHATGWDHHVNEGIAEWPPAPWRILRALVAASYRLDEDDRVATAALVERLTELPVYRLPPSTRAHLRHYMPTDKSSVKVLDAFVAIGQGARAPDDVLVWWPGLELDAGERALLERLAEHIGYLGRAESWVEVAVEDAIEGEPNARPALVGERGAASETVRLLAAQSSDALARWRTRAVDEPTGTGKKRSAISLPANVWEALNVDTGGMQAMGWSQAPGSCWVDYRLAPQRPTRAARRRAAGAGPRGVVFLLDSAVLPTIDQTLVIAERFRSTLMGSREFGPVPWQLSGKRDEQPVDGHSHAYYLPIADKGERIDRVLAWTDEGLENEAWAHIQARLTGTKRLTVRGESDHPLHVVLAGYGDFEQTCALVGADVLGASTTWESVTPFVPPRFSKLRRGELVDSPLEQLRRLAEEVVGTEVVSVDVHESESERTFGWNRFVRYRLKDRERMAGRSGHGFRITFAEPVEGPVALGYGAHFGLGRFRSV